MLKMWLDFSNHIPVRDRSLNHIISPRIEVHKGFNFAIKKSNWFYYILPWLEDHAINKQWDNDKNNSRSKQFLYVLFETYIREKLFHIIIIYKICSCMISSS